tara:strand:+ start:1209 stop:2081 length:873 start_codon:yes stop_codon:yes gene_type:complete
MSQKRHENIEKVAKSCKKFYCDICDYTAFRKSSYTKHLNTQKHKMKRHETSRKSCKKLQKSCKTVYICEYCEKTYKSRNGLWYHKKKCEAKNHNHVGELVTMCSKLIEKTSQSQKTVNITTQNNIENQHNKHISVNVFLNEHCKNAMSLQDFITRLNVSLQDMVNTKQQGYVDGISNIIIKGLEDLPDTDRPIHSTDTKRNKFVVKKENGWTKDDGTEMDNAVTQVKFKHVSALTKWEKFHPDFKENPKELNEWQNMLSSINSVNNNAVKKKIAQAVPIKYAINEINKEK